PLVVVDADVLGRRRTGDETYVENLLRALPAAAPDLRLAALTRRPDLVPEGVEPVHLPAWSQELRMAVRVPLVLRRLRPAVVHFVHALPPALPCPGVLTVQDLSFERDASLMGRRETAIFRMVVPRSARRAARVLAISERTKADLVELYRLPPERVVVTLLGVDPAFRPGGTRSDYLLFAGAIEPRKDPLAAVEAARAVGRPLVAVGPERDRALAAELRARGADVRGYVPKDELVRLMQEAASPTRAAGPVPGSSGRGRSRGRAPPSRPRPSTVPCCDEGQRRRHLARSRGRPRAVPAGARAAGGRAARRREHPRQRPGRPAGGVACARERPAALVCGEREPRRGEHVARARPRRE